MNYMNNEHEKPSIRAVVFLAVCLGSLIGFVIAIGSGYPFLLKIRHLDKSFNRSEALSSKLLENKDLLEVCYPFGDDPRVKQCPKNNSLQATFETVSAHRIKICEGTFFKNCTTVEFADEVADFSASLYVFIPDDFHRDNEDFFGKPIYRTAVVRTTLDNNTSVEQAAGWLIEGIRQHERTQSDKIRNAAEKARDCRTNRIVNDCD